LIDCFGVEMQTPAIIAALWISALMSFIHHASMLAHCATLIATVSASHSLLQAIERFNLKGISHMKRGTLFGMPLIAGLMLLFAIDPVQAQLTRSYVARTGSDGNDCSQATPCGSFATAIANTNANGEVNAVDTGGYTSFTVSKSLTVKANGGVASVSPFTVGITVSAGANDIVILSGLEINAFSNGGTIGIRIVSAKEVHIIDCHIFGGSQAGIRDERTAAGSVLVVRDTNIHDGAGIGVLLAGSNVRATLDNVHANANNFGMAMASGNSMNVSRSTFTGNKTAGVEADAGARLYLEDSVISNNLATGVFSSYTVVLNNSSVNYNGGTGISGPAYSYGNNRVSGNGGPDTAFMPLSLK
jgi:Right handed beta helix region